MVKKRKRATPLMLLWSKREQARFSVATEQAVGLVAELRQLVAELRQLGEQKGGRGRRPKAAGPSAVDNGIPVRPIL